VDVDIRVNLVEFLGIALEVVRLDGGVHRQIGGGDCPGRAQRENRAGDGGKHTGKHGSGSHRLLLTDKRVVVERQWDCTPMFFCAAPGRPWARTAPPILALLCFHPLTEYDTIFCAFSRTSRRLTTLPEGRRAVREPCFLLPRALPAENLVAVRKAAE